MRWRSISWLVLGGMLVAGVASATPRPLPHPPVVAHLPGAPTVAHEATRPSSPSKPVPAELHLHAPALAPVSVPPPSADVPALLATSKQLLARQAVFVRRLLPTSGVTSVEAMATKVSALGPERAAAVELLAAEDKLEIAMRVPSKVRESIAKGGFLNTHDEYRTSGAPHTLRRAQRRLVTEASFLDLPREEYEALPDALKPKYAYLRPTRESGAKVDERDTSSYGDDVFVFKREGVREHATVHAGDTLGKAALDEPPHPATSGVPEKWEHALFPWADRVLLAPHVTLDSKTRELRLDATTPGVQGAEQAPLYTTYLEVQIWRPLGLANVERFEFTKSPPSGPFLTALRVNGVKIFHAGSPEEWRGDESATRSEPRTAR